MLQSGDVNHVLVGGADSLLDPMDLSRYMIEKRLKQDGVMDGFTPGEGAGLLVLSHPSSEKFNDAPLATLNGIGLGEEEGPQDRRGDAPDGPFGPGG